MSLKPRVHFPSILGNPVFSKIASAFALSASALECLQLGAKLPLQATTSLPCWQRCELISFVFNGFEIDCIILIYSLPRKPAQNSLAYADDLMASKCNVGACLTKTPESHRPRPLLRHPLVARTYPRGCTQSPSPQLMRQRRKRRRMQQKT
jgi:hypothetical protein